MSTLATTAATILVLIGIACVIAAFVVAYDIDSED